MTHWRSDVNEWFLPSREKLPVSQTKPAGNTLVDEITFQTLYERMASPLRSYLRMLCRDSALADDLPCFLPLYLQPNHSMMVHPRRLLRPHAVVGRGGLQEP
jgi:hypothetical protein